MLLRLSRFKWDDDDVFGGLGSNDEVVFTLFVHNMILLDAVFF